MPTNTAGTTARGYHTAQVHYLRSPISYLDDAKTITLGIVPAGSIVIDAGVVVSVAFNGATANTLIVGTAGDTDGFATALALGTIGRIPADEMATSNDLGPYTADTSLVCVVTSTGTPSAGAGTVYVTYLTEQ